MSYWIAGKKRFQQFPKLRGAKKFADTVSSVKLKLLAELEIEKGPLLRQAAEEWLTACRLGGERPPLEPATVAGYAAIMKNHVMERLGHKRIGACTQADVREFRGYLLQELGLSRNTAKRVLTVLKMLFGRRSRRSTSPAIPCSASAFACLRGSGLR